MLSITNLYLAVGFIVGLCLDPNLLTTASTKVMIATSRQKHRMFFLTFQEIKMKLRPFLLAALLCISASLVGAGTSTTEASASKPAATSSIPAAGARESKPCSSSVTKYENSDTILAQSRRPNCCGNCRAPGGIDGCWIVPTNGTPQHCSAC